MKYVVLTSAMIAAGASAAMAGGPAAPIIEPVVTAPVVVAPLTFGAWEGGYIGGNIGHGRTDWAGNTDSKGTTAAIRGGYDWQVGRGVWGLGAEYDLGKTDGGGVTVDKAATIFGRVGYDMGQWMPYGQVGYTWADAQAGGVSDSIDGYTLAVGAEYKINPQWSGYGEFSVSEFGNLSEFGNIDAQTEKLKLGVNYRF